MPTPERLTPTQRLHEVTMTALHRTRPEPTTDVEVTRSASTGRYGFKVSVTQTDPDEAYKIAARLAKKAETDFPHGNGA